MQAGFGGEQIFECRKVLAEKCQPFGLDLTAFDKDRTGSTVFQVTEVQILFQLEFGVVMLVTGCSIDVRIAG